MSIRPNRAIPFDDQGGDLMSHKPTDLSSQNTNSSKQEKPRLVPIEENQTDLEKPTSRLKASLSDSFDQKLRVAENSLQQQEENKLNALDLGESMAAGGVGSNVDKIRDILFGGQMRDYEKRFKRLEERFNQEALNFREEMFQRVKALEERMDGEIDTLGEKAKVDRQERLLAQQDLEHSIKGLKNELNSRLTQLDEQFSKDLKNLRQQTLNKFQELALQMRQQNDGLTQLFNQEIAQLQEDKVNRSELATYLNEIAVRLTKNTYDKSPELE